MTHTGRHFLQIPGPTNIPPRILSAIARQPIDHRGPEFKHFTASLLERLAALFNTTEPILIYPASGRGAWEAAIVNTLSAGDKVLICDNGHFADLWSRAASRLQLEVERLPSDWRDSVDPAAVEAHLAADTTHSIKAVALVHNETSTGVVNDVAAVRQAIDNANHPALYMVDVISSLGCMAYQHDKWGVDVTIAGAQKGLMLPPGLGFNAISQKALAATQQATLPRFFWDWHDVIKANQSGLYPVTPATTLLFGLDESLTMLFEEKLTNVFARHTRLGEATRRAVTGWGLEPYCRTPGAHSSSLTAVLLSDGSDADSLRATTLERFNLSLGTGLGKLNGKVFRIGHLGDFNELMLMGTLSGIEMAFDICDIPHERGGILAAMNMLAAG